MPRVVTEGPLRTDDYHLLIRLKGLDMKALSLMIIKEMMITNEALQTKFFLLKTKTNN